MCGGDHGNVTTLWNLARAESRVSTEGNWPIQTASLVQIFSCMQCWFVGCNLNAGSVSCKCWRGIPGTRTLLLMLVTKWHDFVAASNSLGVGGRHRLSHLTTKSRFTVSCPKRGVQFKRLCDLHSCTFSITVLNVVFFLLGKSATSKFYVSTFRNTLSVASSQVF